jgi:16S rRNA G527 N7-methylase RsmG
MLIDLLAPIICALVGAYVKYVIDDLKDEIKTLSAKIEEERKERTQKHDNGMARMVDKVDKCAEKIGDLSETVAGFGGTYITRVEYMADK